jgi:hypothetical protein
MITDQILLQTLTNAKFESLHKKKSLIVSKLLAACSCSLTINILNQNWNMRTKFTKYEVRVVFQPFETYFVLTKKFGASCAGIAGSGCRLGYFSLYPTDNTKTLSPIGWWSKAHNLDNLHPELNPYQPTNQPTNSPTSLSGALLTQRPSSSQIIPSNLRKAKCQYQVSHAYLKRFLSFRYPTGHLNTSSFNQGAIKINDHSYYSDNVNADPLGGVSTLYIPYSVPREHNIFSPTADWRGHIPPKRRQRMCKNPKMVSIIIRNVQSFSVKALNSSSRYSFWRGHQLRNTSLSRCALPPDFLQMVLALIPIRWVVHVGGTNDNESRFVYHFPNCQLSSRIRFNGQEHWNFFISDSALQIGRPHRSLCCKDILRPTARSFALQTLYDPL